MLPVLISQMVVVLKDSAIGYVITFLEMVRQGVQLGAAYGNLLPALIVIAILMISSQLHAVVFRDVARTPATAVQSRAGADARGRARVAGCVRGRRRRHDLNPPSSWNAARRKSGLA